MTGKPTQPAATNPAAGARAHRAAPPQQLPTALEWALFLDLDGTLCGYRDDPADVVLDAALGAVLARLVQRLDGAVCIVSGRSADDLDRILHALPLPRIAEHGAAGMALEDADFLAELIAVEQRLHILAAGKPGVWVERKPSSCVLHYRQAPHLADCLRGAVLPLRDGLRRLRLLDGHGVFEFAARDRDKGSALRAQMQLAPFAGRQPVVVGDDVTDEDAFVAAIEFGGFGIDVGTRASPAARFHLDDHRAVGQWLQRLSMPQQPATGSGAAR